ncbi:pectinesterase family protein [Parasediminibacterium sp. JCM 36343]|uniref:pectinesterase family protein n=1 Tax=Parasediminibacterium sp. JCM 36343 TaxID=3374279 RepID=UPI003979A03E
MKMFTCLPKKPMLLFCFIFLLGTAYSQYNTVVDVHGTGNFNTIQAAINAAPTGSTTPYVIFIKKGKYREVVTIPSTKPFIELIGESMAETIVSYDNYSGKPNPAGGTFGTSTSATLNIAATDCMIMNLSVENATGYGVDANAIPVAAAGDGPQALALNVSADRVVFYNCRFNGGQDTVFAGGPGKRNYFKNCYIDGNTDFIFGDATAIFDTCVIYPRTRLDNGGGGYVTAVNTKAVSQYGYVFRDCKLTKNRGTTNYTLGRPWQSGSGGTYNKTVYLNTAMGANISAVGWSVFDANTDPNTVLYAEYNSTDYKGNLVDVSKRISWSRQLTAQDAAKYYNNDTVFTNATTPAIATWNPTAIWPVLLAKAFVPEISVSNLLARNIAGKTSVTWNITFPMVGITNDLYKCTDGVNYTKVSTQISTEDTACNFSYSDSLPAAGSNLYYLVKASKTGLTAITSDTGIISSTPTLFAYGNLGNFLQGVGAPSASQVYQVSGINLTNNVTITPPATFEVSVDSGTTWNTHAKPLVLIPKNNAITSKYLYVRMNATVPGSYDDSIYHSTIGGLTVPLRVKGKMLSIPLLNDSYTLQQLPFTTSNSDSGSVRAAGILPSVAAFSSVLSPSSLAATPAYSASGVAFANDATVGKWSVGAALNRGCYIQFAMVADSTHKIRIDSILLNTSFLGSSNGALGVVYSKSGFKKDSADIASGISPTGVGLPAANYGAYAHPAKLSRIAGTNDSTYRFLPDSNITLKPNDTLTIRLYYGLGSTSTPRWGYLKNVIVKGNPTSITLPLSLLSFTASYAQGTAALSWSTASEVNTAYFVVEKSSDGVSFATLTTIVSHNTAGVNNYSDNQAQASTVYYRLKMVDKDGKYTFSKIVKVAADNSAAFFKIFPNPVKTSLTVVLSEPSANTHAEVVSFAGKKLMDVNFENGIVNKKIRVAQLAVGQYFFVIRNKQGEVSTLKFNKD